jgi:glutaredoxin
LEEYKYILYLKKECVFCVKAENVLSLKEIYYKAIYFDENLKLLEQLKDAYSWSTVPMVFEKNENKYTFIGGYTDLLERQEVDE